MHRLCSTARAYLAWARWSLVADVGYRIRPYDMLADRRRWFWQHPQRCAYVAGTWYLGLHTAPPAPDRNTEVTGGSYARVTVNNPGAGWPTVNHRAYFTAPAGGQRVTHAAFTAADGRVVWLDMTTDPPTPCDPPADRLD